MSSVNEEVLYYRQIKLSNKVPKLRNIFHLSKDVKPHKMQKDIIEVWDNKRKEVPNLLLPSGRRVGKSYTVTKIVLTELVIPQASVALIAPSDKQVSIIFNSVVKEVKKLGLPIAKIDINKKVLILENEAAFYGGSEKTVTDLEGKKYSLIVIDEGGLIKNLQGILDSLSPSLMTYGIYPDTGKPLGRVIVIGTPKEGAIDYYNLFLDAKKNPNWFVGQYPSSVNPINTKEFLESEKERMDEQTYQQEYEGKFVAMNKALVFYSFDGSKHIKNLIEVKQNIDKQSNLFAGLDIGATDSCAYLLSYVEGGVFYIIDGFRINNIEEERIAKYIKDIDNKYKTKPIRFIDPSAKLTRLGLASTYDIETYPANNSVKESISLINQLFRQNKIYIDERLYELIKELETIMWSNNPNSKDHFKKGKGHHFDYIASLRYLIFTTYRQYMDNVINSTE